MMLGAELVLLILAAIPLAVALKRELPGLRARARARRRRGFLL